MKTLPKAQRKQLVPVPDYVDRAMPMLKVGEQGLLAQLATALLRLSGLQIDINEWAANRIDDYYLMNIRVLDNTGKLLAQGRDLRLLNTQLADQVQQGIAEESSGSFNSKVLQDWNFGHLETRHEFKRGGATLTAYPCLRDDGDHVVLELAESAQDAKQKSLYGVLRLLLLRLSQQTKLLRASLFRHNAVQLQFAAVGEDKKKWLEDSLIAAARQSFAIDPDNLPETEAHFDKLWQEGRASFTADAERYAEMLTEILGHYSDIRRALKKLNSLSWIHSINDVNKQLDGLFFNGFITALNYEELSQYPRYLKGILQRLAKLDGNYQRDRQCTLILEPLQNQLSDFLLKAPDELASHPALRDYRWQLEEFRISLFAQNIGTRSPVSEKRLKQLWKSVTQDVTFKV